jgi:hypothetical protein
MLLAGAVSAQRGGSFTGSRDHPAIRYSTHPSTDAIARLSLQLQEGGARLAFDPDNGYLRAVLAALRVPVESQVTVFSGTSNQAELIKPGNPRAIFFNDSVAIGWVRGSEVLELAAINPDPGGAVFYTLAQRPVERPRFKRDDTCLACHLTWDTAGVPGPVVMSVFSVPAPDDKYSYATGAASDHRSPFSERWGGWYVTGRLGSIRHLGNDTALSRPHREAAARPLVSLQGLFDPRGFVSPHSDVVALMVLEHQAHMMNLITRTGWEARVGTDEGTPSGPPSGAGERQGRQKVQDAASELVDYMLVVDETPLPGPTRGSSGFAEKFEEGGPRDTRGRSLRKLDLEHRLMRYPCSYMIYSEAFDRLPKLAKDAVYDRMWRVLSGQIAEAPYSRLARADRQAVAEILLDTKPDLPEFFRAKIAR